MLLHSQSELEDEGRPSRKELFWAVAATPLLLSQIVSNTIRILHGFQGAPLKISGWFDVYVLRSQSTWHFAAAVGLYVVFIAFALLLLWACTLQFQRWLFWRGKN